MGIPDHLTCLLRNLYAGQEVTVRTGHGTTDWFQRGKGVRQGCTVSPCLFNKGHTPQQKNGTRNVVALHTNKSICYGKRQIEDTYPGEVQEANGKVQGYTGVFNYVCKISFNFLK